MKKFPRNTTKCHQCGKIIDYGEAFVSTSFSTEYHIKCAGAVITNISNFLGTLVEEVSAENLERIKYYLIGLSK